MVSLSGRILDHPFLLEQEGSNFLLKDIKKGQSILLSLTSATWLLESFRRLLYSSTFEFFLLKEKVDQNFMRLAKFRAKENWFVEFAVWPITGGRRNIHNIPFGNEKAGWQDFKEMIDRCIQHFKKSPALQSWDRVGYDVDAKGVST
ncbi:uncharacterized protein LOC120075514 [Benincasa hispida]|uniref:uncharacterized protein LOC120075514 n=1 Tax=Benincasa hispida TaxID=102211 RepID=UPI0018FF1B3D|nr:uncharacterized protein LOC120075514 [Benincasa hispida]